MFRLLAFLLLCMTGGILPSSASSQPVSIGAIYGAQIGCDPTFPGCHAPPLTLTVLCNQFVVNVNCPKTFHPSWIDNERFWGSDGTNCVTSANGGVNWSTCAVQPFAGTVTHVASTTNGNIVAVSSVAGTCTIKLSINNGSSWATQFTDANQCLPIASASQMVRCQPSSGQCDYVFASPGVTTRTYRTVDNGNSWVQSNTASAVVQSATSMVFDTSSGIAGGSVSIGTREALATGGSWGVSNAWTGSNNYGGATAALWSGTSTLFAYEGVALVYRRLDSIGSVLKSFTPVGARVTGFPSITCFQLSSFVAYCAGEVPAGTQAIWISQDDLTTFTLLTSNAQVAGRATFFIVNGAVYISISGTTGAFYRVS